MQGTLHRLAADARFLAGPIADPERLDAVLRKFEQVWSLRRKLLDPRVGPGGGPPRRSATTSGDCSCWRSAENPADPSPSAAERRGRLAELDEAERDLGPWPALAWKRDRLAAVGTGGDPLADSRPPGPPPSSSSRDMPSSAIADFARPPTASTTPSN